MEQQRFKAWKSLFEEAPSPLLISDLETNLLYSNRTACDTLGFSDTYEEQGPLLSWLMPLEPESLQSVSEKLENLTHQSVVKFDAVALTSDRDQKFLSVKAKRLDDQSILWDLVDVTELKTSDRLLDFFASSLKSLDFNLSLEETFSKGVQIAVQKIADWCRVDLIEGSRLIPKKMLHKNPKLQPLLEDMSKILNDEGRFSPHYVIRSGHSEFLLNQEGILQEQFTEEQKGWQTLKDLGMTNYICVPISVKNEVRGTFTLGSKDDGRRWTSTELIMAEELASKFGIALERATTLQSLKELKDRAELASQSKTQFLANVSHEIRTPLAAVLGFADLILNPAYSLDEKTMWGSKIRQNGARLVRLIDDILDLSKVEAGKLDVEIRQIDLKKLLQDLYANKLLQTENKNLALVFKVENALPRFVETDDVRLAQILTNLLGNAIKFTHYGQVSLTVSSQIIKGRTQIEFLVQDTGTGMSSDQTSRLFQPFSQGDESLKRRFGGSGLGLALSKGLAQRLGGDVSLVKTQSGVGSEFMFTLDVGEICGEQMFSSLDLGEIEFSDSEMVLPSLQGLKVLIVEDSLDNQTMIRRFVENAGAEVVIAQDGQEGVEKGMSEKVDLILMDIQMPIKDGYEATTELRNFGYRGPIVALTAHAMPDERDRCLRVGCNSHLSKPVLRKDLISTIARLTRRETL